MKMKCYLSFVLILVCFIWSNAQSNVCCLPRSAHSDLYTVDAEQVRCLARNSERDLTMFYTFADWCTYCKKSLPEVVGLAEKYGTELYLLLVDEEDETYYSIDRTIAMLDTVYHNTLKAVIITDSLYTPRTVRKLNAPIRKIIDIKGKSAREKYSRFLKDISPNEETAGMGKLIVLDRQGEVLGICERDYDRLDSPHKGYDTLVELLVQGE